MIRPGVELETLLASPHIHDPYPYPGDLELLPSYSSEPLESVHSFNLRAQVKHALAHAWKFDPIACSVKAAFQLAREKIGSINHGLTEEERRWVTGEKLTTMKKAPKAAPIDFEQARKGYELIKNLDDEVLSLKDTKMDQELDQFYGPDGTDLRPIEDDSDDEGFFEPNAIATTMVSLPEKSLMEEGVTPGGIFQDSGISMDEGYAEYSLAHSLANTTKKSTPTVPSDWPTFKATVAPFRPPKKTDRPLRLVGDQNQCHWPGRRQGPYDLCGLQSWVDASKSDDVEILDEYEASSSDAHSMRDSLTPRTVTGETSVSRESETATGDDVKAISSSISAAFAVAEVQDADRMVEGPSVDTAHENPLPAEVTSSVELVERAQEAFEAMLGILNGDPPEATTESFGQEHTSPLDGNNENRGNVAIPERINDTPISDNEAADNEASVGVVQPVSEDQPQHFPFSIRNGSDNEPFVPAPHVVRGVPRIDIDANAQARCSTTTTAMSMPVNQRIRHIQQVQVDTAATPEAGNVNLTPEYDSDMDVEDASDGSLEVRLPNSPTTDTQNEQNALGRYVEETKSQPNPARQSSSTVSLDGSMSEEVSLIPTGQRPSPLEGHAGFSKGMKILQKKSDAGSSFSPSKANPETPSSSKTAPIPLTPATGKDPAPFPPATPFQPGTHAHADVDSPGRATAVAIASAAIGKSVENNPAPKANKKSKKSIMNVFKSPKLASRSPEHATSSPNFVVAPTNPAAGAADLHRGSPFGSHGLLFHKAKTSERDTKNVLNSLKLSPGRESGALKRKNSDDSEGEPARDTGVDVYQGEKWVHEPQPPTTSRPDLGTDGGRAPAPAAVVPRVRPRDEDEDERTQSADAQGGQPRQKKARKSTRTRRRAGGPDAEVFSRH